MAVLAPTAAKADGVFAPDGKLMLVAVAVFVLPSEVGVAIPTADASRANFVLGWSWQLPVGDTGNNRVLGAVDLLPHADGADARGRVGYRYSRRYAFGGLALAVDGAGASLSPELGVKFGHVYKRGDIIDPAFHLLARAEVAPDTGRLLGTTVLLGYDLF